MIFRQVDGRLLNLLTVDDLSFLRVSNLLHHYSIRRGIQVTNKRNELYLVSTILSHLSSGSEAEQF